MRWPHYRIEIKLYLTFNCISRDITLEGIYFHVKLNWQAFCNFARWPSFTLARAVSIGTVVSYRKWLLLVASAKNARGLGSIRFRQALSLRGRNPLRARADAPYELRNSCINLSETTYKLICLIIMNVMLLIATLYKNNYSPISPPFVYLVFL